MPSDSSKNRIAPESSPAFHVPVIKLRQADGSLVVKAGRPEIIAQEVSVTEFHRQTGVSKRHIQTLCEQGLIKHRRLTPKLDSKILILRSEIKRFRSLQDDLGDVPTANSSQTPTRSPAAHAKGYPNRTLNP